MNAAAFLTICKSKSIRIATAESCTGGLIAAALTDIPGSSDVFERGFVTYSNLSKTQMLGVSAALIETHGAVSEPVAVEMAKGALAHSAAHVSVAVTGIAGPGGGSAEKPVGLVYIATVHGNRMNVQKYMFNGDRTEIRRQAMEEALKMMTAILSS